MEPFLSIVIPAHNEERRLPATLHSIREFLSAQPYSSEVIVVENGSDDGTASIVERIRLTFPSLQLLREPAAGKGLAVRRGMLAAQGAYRFMCDADLSMPITELPRFLPPQVAASDVTIASREAPGAVRHAEPRHRHWVGRAFNLLVQLLVVGGIRDTQCGFKCFTAAAATDIFSVQRIDGWTFDVEVLFIARKRGYRITEIRIPWHYIPGSRVRLFQDSFTMLLDLFRIRLGWLQGRYAPR